MKWVGGHHLHLLITVHSQHQNVIKINKRRKLKREREREEAFVLCICFMFAVKSPKEGWQYMGITENNSSPNISKVVNPSKAKN